MTEILRASIFHTPANPFTDPKALKTYADGALAIRHGTIAACGDYADVIASHPEAVVRDLRGGFLIPGLIDTHLHFPQIRILGSLGCSLLEWLERFALPEEARFADTKHARCMAGEFVHALASHGTTTALVFGSHFAAATSELFEAALRRGLRVFTGLVLADRSLCPELRTTPDRAYQESTNLIRQYHGRGRVGYAVTPRFALSASEQMLEVCQTLLHEDSTLRFTSHINENVDEISETARLFPWSAGYLDVYEQFNLIGRQSVLAHNVHPTDSELTRIAAHDASISHCPCSNAALGSGIFPMQRHLDRGVRFALGTDVGGGTGFGLFKEGLQAYLMQRIAPQPLALRGSHMLYLATRAGAEALMLDHETGDFEPGKAADFVYLRPREASTLASVLRGSDDPEHMLAAIFMLAESETLREVRVAGDVVFHA